MKVAVYVSVLSLVLLQSCGSKKSVVVPECVPPVEEFEESVIDTEISDTIVGEEEVDSEPIPEIVEVDRFHEHLVWTELLQKNVTEAGWVDYKGMVADSAKLNEYLTDLASHSPDTSWTYNEQKAYWINVYNAFTVKLIIDNYPVKTIKELGGSIYKVNTPWDIKFIHIGDETYDLNNVEHGILRKDFADPRIHAAVNCASVSCPKLLGEAFIAEKLDEQLTQQMKAFVNDELNNTITPSKMTISKIFQWFSGDFTEEMSVREYINQFTDVEITKSTSIKYRAYDWNLNEEK